MNKLKAPSKKGTFRFAFSGTIRKSLSLLHFFIASHIDVFIILILIAISSIILFLNLGKKWSCSKTALNGSKIEEKQHYIENQRYRKIIKAFVAAS